MSGPPEDAALRAALEEALSAAAARARIRRMDRRVSDYSTSFTIEELGLTLDCGDRLEVVFKDLGWGSLLAGARDVRPQFLYDPRREIAVYQKVLAGAGLGTARCYGAAVDPAADRYWLFLEKVQGPKLCHVGDFDAWVQAARWLASLHTRFPARDVGRAGGLEGLPLLRYDRDLYHRWLSRAREFVAGGGATAGPARDALGWLAERYSPVVDRLAALDLTLIHGEFYASNVLLRQPPAGEEGWPAVTVCPLDWELAALAPGAFDLAALTAGNWTESQQAALLKAYHEAFRDEATTAGGSETGRRPPSLEELADALDYCRLHQAVQWLGWAACWSAPPDQAQDWLGKAMSLAQKLRL